LSFICSLPIIVDRALIAITIASPTLADLHKAFLRCKLQRRRCRSNETKGRALSQPAFLVLIWISRLAHRYLRGIAVIADLFVIDQLAEH
jgi:hypothetical protein